MPVAVAHIDEPGITDGNAVDCRREDTGCPGADLLVRGLSPPLPQELAVLVKYRDAPVAITIRYIDVSCVRMGDSLRWAEKRIAARVKRFTAHCAV